jgi:hypothetical protein
MRLIAQTRRPDSPTIVSRYGWIRILLTMAMIVVCSLSFLAWLDWTAFYSGIAGLPSRAADAQNAQRRAALLFWAFSLSVAVSSFLASSLIRLGGLAPKALEIAVRFAIGVAISIVLAGVLAIVLLTVRNFLK